MAAFAGVQYYQIPTLLASTFGKNKGLCSSYIDGLAYLSSFVLWKMISCVLLIPHVGWLFTWCGVGLVVVVATVSMNFFLDYFLAEDGTIKDQQEKLYLKVDVDDDDADTEVGTEAETESGE
jgi:hypothetical protein